MECDAENLPKMGTSNDYKDRWSGLGWLIRFYLWKIFFYPLFGQNYGLNEFEKNWVIERNFLLIESNISNIDLDWI